MRDLNTMLRNGDPAAADRELTPSQVDVMRRQVIIAARQPDVVRTPWHQPLAVAAMVALTIAAGVIVGQRVPHSDEPSRQQPAPSRSEDQRRQLQFSTPGGTRIIWVFDPDFAVKETVP